MAKPIKFIQAYEFLRQKEIEEQPFTIDEICQATGWKISTARTYVTKKWEPFLTPNGSTFNVMGVTNYSQDEFVRLMSQKNKLSADPRRPETPLEVERLVIKAREAALNALDGYNRPSTIFRTESYTVMMVIAWRSLLHAIFQKRGTDYFYKDDVGNRIQIDGDDKAWELAECVRQFFGSSTNPIRTNLEFIVGLRNRIEHRYVPAIDPHVAGECQALVLNFDELLEQQFGNYYALKESLAVPLQTSVLRSSSQVDAMRHYQGKQYDDLKDYIDTFRSSIPDPIYQDQRYSFRVFLIPKVGNHESSSDLAFEFIKYDPLKPEDMEALRTQVVLIKERQIPVANAGTFKPSHVAAKVAERIGRSFKIHHHTNSWKMYGVRQSGETAEGCNIKYCQFDQVHRDYIYTEAWIDFLVQKLSDEAEYNRLLEYREE